MQLTNPRLFLLVVFTSPQSPSCLHSLACYLNTQKDDALANFAAEEYDDDDLRRPAQLAEGVYKSSG